MQLTVKILQGAECQLEVSENSTVSMLKTLVESRLAVPRAAQKLVFRGKTLQDDDTMTACRLTDGAKVFLVTAKPAAGAPAAAQSPAPASAAAQSAAAAPAPAAIKLEPASAGPDPWTPLRTLAERCLGQGDADRFLAEFKKKFDQRLGSMSMDDIQRFCASNMTEF